MPAIRLWLCGVLSPREVCVADLEKLRCNPSSSRGAALDRLSQTVPTTLESVFEAYSARLLWPCGAASLTSSVQLLSVTGQLYSARLWELELRVPHPFELDSK